MAHFWQPLTEKVEWNDALGLKMPAKWMVRLLHVPPLPLILRFIQRGSAWKITIVEWAMYFTVLAILRAAFVPVGSP